MFSIFSSVEYQFQITFQCKVFHGQLNDTNSLLQVENSGVKFKHRQGLKWLL